MKPNAEELADQVPLHAEEHAQTTSLACRTLINEDWVGWLKKMACCFKLLIQELIMKGKFWNVVEGKELCSLTHWKSGEVLQKMLQVQEFVGVKVQDLQSEQVKIHTRPLQEQIQNWDEVSRHLQGTQFENFLQDKDYF